MWRINYKRLTLEEVLIMAYMKLLEARDAVVGPGLVTQDSVRR